MPLHQPSLHTALPKPHCPLPRTKLASLVKGRWLDGKAQALTLLHLLAIRPPFLYCKLFCRQDGGIVTPPSLRPVPKIIPRSMSERKCGGAGLSNRACSVGFASCETLGKHYHASLRLRPFGSLHRAATLCDRYRASMHDPHSASSPPGTKKAGLCLFRHSPAFLVPMAGVEPARYCYQRILSPSRLPIPSHRLIKMCCKTALHNGNNDFTV